MRAVPEHTIWCLGCICVAAGEQMILDLILSLPGQNYPIKIFWTNLKQQYELAPVVYFSGMWLQLFQSITRSFKIVLNFFERLFNSLKKQTFWCYVSYSKNTEQYDVFIIEVEKERILLIQLSYFFIQGKNKM